LTLGPGDLGLGVDLHGVGVCANISLLLLTFGVRVCLLILFPLGVHPDFEGVKWCSGLFLVELVSANVHVFSV
jgi:hypothetical protein